MGEMQPRCITKVQGDMRGVKARGRSLTGTNGGDVLSSPQEMFGFNR